MTQEIRIEQIKTNSASLVKELAHLVMQLGNNYADLSSADVQEMLDSQNCFLFVAKDQTKIIGMITLIVYRIPYTKKSILEDLVVDKQYRGQGIGTKLIKKAIEKAKEMNVYYIDFTSRPMRKSANQLYEKLGFAKRETNVYRRELHINNT